MTVVEQALPTKPKRKHKPNWQFDTPLDTSEITAMLDALAQLDLPGDDGEPMENERELLSSVLTKRNSRPIRQSSKLIKQYGRLMRRSGRLIKQSS